MSDTKPVPEDDEPVPSAPPPPAEDEADAPPAPDPQASMRPVPHEA